MIAIVWAVMMILFKQPLAEQLATMAPTQVWIVAAFGLGSAQIVISRSPKLFINTTLHWIVAFGSAVFWMYLATTVYHFSHSPITIAIYWLCAAATWWDLAHA